MKLTTLQFIGNLGAIIAVCILIYTGEMQRDQIRKQEAIIEAMEIEQFHSCEDLTPVRQVARAY